MNGFLSSILSKKLGFAIAVEALIQTLHTTADSKAFYSALVAIAFLIAQGYVDAHAPKLAPAVPETPPPKETP